MALRSRLAFLLAFAVLAAAPVFAGENPIDLSLVANEPWTFTGPNDYLIINGSTFPVGIQYFGGVPFSTPDSPNNYWGAGAAADFGPGVVSVTIPIGFSGVTSVYTLLNTMWGWAGPSAYVFITFNGSGGATQTVPLVGNVNVRDYNQDGNTNTINGTSTVQVWDNGLGQRLDRQEFILPPEFRDQELTSITITDTGNEGSGVNGSRTVLAAVTVSTCATAVAEGITMATGPIVYHAGAQVYVQHLYVTNHLTTPIPGPVFVILENLPDVTVLNKFVRSACIAPLGSPTVLVLPKGSSLAAGTTLDFPLLFQDPSGTPITYTPLALK